MPLTLIKDPAGRPAVDTTGIRGAHPDLAKKADKATVSLSKRGIAGIRAQVVLYLDHSGSMRGDYATGRVQTLVERTLGYALAVDKDGIIPVISWDTSLYHPLDVTVDTYTGVVERSLWNRRTMGSTGLDFVLADIYTRAERTTDPLLAVVVTDGNPNRGTERRCTSLVCELARYPVFLKFLAVRDVPYLDELDDLPPSARLLDNVDTKKFPDLGAVSDLEFADAMADEWDSWFAAATRAGVLV